MVLIDIMKHNGKMGMYKMKNNVRWQCSGTCEMRGAGSLDLRTVRSKEDLAMTYSLQAPQKKNIEATPTPAFFRGSGSHSASTMLTRDETVRSHEEIPLYSSSLVRDVEIRRSEGHMHVPQ